MHFTTTIFALIRENLKINVRESSEMDQADIELRTTIIKCWPHTKRDKIDLLVPPPKCKIQFYNSSLSEREARDTVFVLHIVGMLISSTLYQIRTMFNMIKK